MRYLLFDPLGRAGMGKGSWWPLGRIAVQYIIPLYILCAYAEKIDETPWVVLKLITRISCSQLQDNVNTCPRTLDGQAVGVVGFVDISGLAGPQCGQVQARTEHLKSCSHPFFLLHTSTITPQRSPASYRLFFVGPTRFNNAQISSML